jgi:hypothetical protein
MSWYVSEGDKRDRKDGLQPVTCSEASAADSAANVLMELSVLPAATKDSCERTPLGGSWDGHASLSAQNAQKGSAARRAPGTIRTRECEVTGTHVYYEFQPLPPQQPSGHKVLDRGSLTERLIRESPKVGIECRLSLNLSRMPPTSM